MGEAGARTPRRKYGHMVRPHQPVPREKCRLCRLGYPCPEHMDTEELRRRREESARIRSSKEARRAAKGGSRARR